MHPLYVTGKSLIIIGLIIIVIGLVLTFAAKLPYVGRLPGDIYYKKDDFVFYFPLATSLLVSILASLILYFVFRK